MTEQQPEAATLGQVLTEAADKHREDLLYTAPEFYGERWGQFRGRLRDIAADWEALEGAEADAAPPEGAGPGADTSRPLSGLHAQSGDRSGVILSGPGHVACDTAIAGLRARAGEAGAECAGLRESLAAADNAIGQVVRHAGTWAEQGGQLDAGRVAGILLDVLAPWTGMPREPVPPEPDFGRIAYEAETEWLNGIMPGGNGPAWDDLDPEHREVYRRLAGTVAEAVRAADETLPPGTYEAADKAFEAFLVNEGITPPRDELEAALLAAAPLIRAQERERIRQLAIRFDAIYDPVGDGVPEPFADLLTEPS